MPTAQTRKFPTSVLAFDPGTRGGAFFSYSNRNDICAWERPKLNDNGRIDKEWMVEYFRFHGECLPKGDKLLTIIEDVWVMPKQGASSSAKFIESYAVAVGASLACDLHTVLVNPRVWKKDLGLQKEKDASVQLALQLFPWCEPSIRRVSEKTGRSLTGHNHDYAEALLLAYWGVNFV